MQLINFSNINITKDNFQINTPFKSPSQLKFEALKRQKALEFDAKTIQFLELLYKYPKNIKVLWNEVDELNGDSFLESNFDIVDHSFPFTDFLKHYTFNIFGNKRQKARSPTYSINDFLTGYQNKNATSNFYSKETKIIQKSLEKIPVYTILNGRGEMVLARKHETYTDVLNYYDEEKGGLHFRDTKSRVEKNIHNFCGSFNRIPDTDISWGFFFLDRGTAEMYLKEMADSDVLATSVLGLQVQCVSLDVAYRITREYHPDTDFRFVPKFEEVFNLLKNHVDDDNIIFDKGQQQLRFRRRSVNFMPWIGKIGNWITPFNSFLSNSEYYKGIPIYIVQMSDIEENIIPRLYYIFAGVLDHAYGAFYQKLDAILGFGKNWILQGSIDDINIKSPKEVTNYIFFNYEEAKDFCSKNNRKIVRFKGGRISKIEPFIRKPRIFAYNLEDFIEDWEDVIKVKCYPEITQKKAPDLNNIQTISADNSFYSPPQLFDAKKTLFVPLDESVQDISDYSGKNPVVLKLTQFKRLTNIKMRALISYINIAFNYAPST